MDRRDVERAGRRIGSAAPRLMAVAVLFGLGATCPAVGQTVGQPADQVAGQPVVQPATTPTAVGTTSSYLIGPGDSLQVFVWRNPDLSVTVPVRPDGKISTPLVEDMVAVGKTPSQLARDIERVLGEYVRSPQVNVIVATAQNAFNQVKVLGQVAQPRSVAYREGMTALDAMLEVGGLTPFAAGNRAKILRKDEKGIQREIKVRLESLLKKGRAADNPALKPGDILIVPEALF